MRCLFFSVDVETTGPTPCCGELLTVGAVPVREDGTVLDVSFYARLQYKGHVGSGERATLEWWAQQAEDVHTEAFSERASVFPGTEGVVRSSRFDAAASLDAWVRGLREQEGCEQAAFVAHPAVFDWMWVCDLLWAHLGRNVFGYRALCLRSMGFGLGRRVWNEDRTDDPDLYVPSAHPHHALYDARAQAEQLSKLLWLRGAL